GQGSRSRWQLGDYVFSAGGGIAFTFSLFERTFRIKPSLEWVNVQYDYIGVTHRAVKLKQPSCGGICAKGTNLLSSFREISLTSVETRNFDGIGGGLELEFDTSRLGPIQTSIYATGRVYRFLDSLDQTMTASNEFGETSSWTAEP